MMRRYLTILLATSALIVGASGASAADMPVRAYTKAPLYAPPYNWTGLYAGVNAGYGWTKSMNGVIGGGQIGYNWQTSNIVLGFEADIDASGQRGTKNVTNTTGAISLSETDKMNYFGTARARLGVAMDRWLPYVTGGLAYTSVNRNGSAVAGAAGTYSATDTKMGYAVGAGVEYAFSHNWSAKLEYLFLGYNGNTNTYALAPATSVSYGQLSDNIVRIGANYHF
jgi:outer membrane immunogenic protein